MIARSESVPGRREAPAEFYGGCAAAETSCQGVRIRGPSPVMAIVNSKWAASEPSWEKIDQWSSATRSGVAARGDHRLHGQHHPLLQRHARPGGP